MITWLAVRTFLSGAGRFIAAYWQAIAVALIVAVAFHYKTAYESAVQESATFKSDIAKALELRQVSDGLKRDQAAKEVAASEVTYKQQLEGIKHEYEKRTKATNITIDTLRSELRDKIRGDSFTLPTFTETTAEPAEIWRERYTAIARQYETLKLGCAVTTADFNVCREWADTACDQVGCE